MRKITGYTTTEVNEIKAIGELVPLTDFLDATFNDRYPNLAKKIKDSRPNGELKIIYDLADYLRGKAEFPKQLYYVKLADDSSSYLNLDKRDNDTFLSGSSQNNGAQTRFTMDEIKDIDERYVPFAVPVEADDE